MRLHSGAPPDDPNFHPQAQGWNSLREPSSVWLFILLVFPIVVILWYFLLWLIGLLFPPRVPTITSFWSLLFILVLIIPVHELIHAVCYPAFGRSPDTIIGVWTRRGAFYAHYEGAMTRNRFLLVLAAPFVLLTLVLMPVLAWLHPVLLADPLTSSLVILSLLNGVFSAADVLGFLLVLWQVPRRTIVRNKGWKTFWKPAQVSG